MAKANIPLPKPKETRDDNDHQDVSVSVENASEHTGFVQALRLILYLIIFIALAGKFLTGSYVWEYEGKWIRLRTYFPPPQRLFTESELAKYDGMDPDKPVYLGIDGDVYDVTKGKAYQPGGPYHVLTGVDAARAFGTGCFKTHRTHDLRALSDAEIKGIRHWKKFYENHPNYFKCFDKLRARFSSIWTTLIWLLEGTAVDLHSPCALPDGACGLDFGCRRRGRGPGHK
ncbi:cytochrome b5 [Lentinula edodes]|uniref:Cytochrome b5 n=1 Tax=Lentinula edodes TaxID=5353 RepID=A0A1Q3EMA7_LENED|nr:cytochrome b5 [Lentinula edodes]